MTTRLPHAPAQAVWQDPARAAHQRLLFASRPAAARRPAGACGRWAPAVRAAAAAAGTAVDASVFEELAAGTARKYIMVSGKGGVGKTSLAASLAVRFAQAGHTTLVVSTDPAHSLGDSLDQVRAQRRRITGLGGV